MHPRITGWRIRPTPGPPSADPTLCSPVAPFCTHRPGTRRSTFTPTPPRSVPMAVVGVRVVCSTRMRRAIMFFHIPRDSASPISSTPALSELMNSLATQTQPVGEAARHGTRRLQAEAPIL